MLWIYSTCMEITISCLGGPTEFILFFRALSLTDSRHQTDKMHRRAP